MRVKYIIIGQGLSGSCFALECLKRGLSFILIDDKDQIKTSQIASGIFNPLVLKRFSLSWNAPVFLEQMHKTFKQFESLLAKNYRYKLPIYHIFKDAQEIHTWKRKSPDLKGILNPSLIKNPYPFINAPYEMGCVKKGGWVNLSDLLIDFRDFLLKKKYFIEEKFLYPLIKLKGDLVQYKEIQANYIVFCEGPFLKENPYFNYLPLIQNKGEILCVKLNKNQINEIIHSKVFILPQLEKNLYKIGSTYQRIEPLKETTLDYKVTTEAKSTLLNKLSFFLKAPFEIHSHKFGIRPTITDRRPIIGKHNHYKSLTLLNGMGSRGTILAPNMAKMLMEHLEDKKEIPFEVNLNRFPYSYP